MIILKLLTTDLEALGHVDHDTCGGVAVGQDVKQVSSRHEVETAGRRSITAGTGPRQCWLNRQSVNLRYISIAT
jgi:hypothetical protein